MEPAPGTNLLYGENAQGKTNVLEAIYLCGVSHSHRGARDREMISFGEEEAHLKCELSKKGLSHRIDVHLKKNKNKGIAVDGLPETLTMFAFHTRRIRSVLHTTTLRGRAPLQ